MANKSKSTKKPAAKKQAAKTAKPAAQATNGKQSKQMLCAALLSRSSGCTARELLDATGWPTISVPATAKAAQLKLRKQKTAGQPTQYFGTPA